MITIVHLSLRLRCTKKPDFIIPNKLGERKGNSQISIDRKIEKVPREVQNAKSGKVTTSFGKGLVSISRTYASPK